MESAEQKAARRRLAKERNMTPAELEAALVAEQKKAKQPKPKFEKAPEPKPLWPDPPQPGYKIDSRLVEIMRAWEGLTDRDREELVMMLRVKVHLNKKPLVL